MSLFNSIDLLPDDPILKLPIVFAADKRIQKVNLGVGVYKNAQGEAQVLKSVRLAEEELIQKNLNKEYPPIQGETPFIQECLKLIFGEELSLISDGKVFAAQTVGGTNALRIGAEFLAYNKISPITYVSDPTWPNHFPIFLRAGMKVNTYPYYDYFEKNLNFSEMCASITQMPPSSLILLQPCCHNPTGIDPSLTQWKELSDLIKKYKLIPFFDLAYHGFGKSFEDDIQPIKVFVRDGHTMLAAYSCSKNFGLYGERVGLLAIVSHNAETTRKIGSHIKQIIRCSYSMPPLHGQRIASTILQSKMLREMWQAEVATMRARIIEMRNAFAAKLKAKMPEMDVNFITKQSGMFSLSGLKEEQVEKLQRDFGIYMPSNGRLNIAGLNLENLDPVVHAFSEALQK